MELGHGALHSCPPGFGPAFVVPGMPVSHVLVFVFLVQDRDAAHRHLQPSGAGATMSRRG